MIKVAELFFNNQLITLNSIEDFFDTDLCLYFEKLFKAKLEVSNTGFIKIIKKNDKYYFFENIFYDWANQESDIYINFKDVRIKAGSIVNTEEGKSLSVNGYAIFENSSDFIEATLKRIPFLNFDEKNCERLTEPSRMFRYSPKVWETPDWNSFDLNSKVIYENMRKRLEEITVFSNVLSSLDAFDNICLGWTEGRTILPHNDIDIRMLINLVSYNTENCERSRHLCVGEYDWYSYIFHTILTDQWEATINITAKKEEKKRLLVNTKSSVLVNVFNPKFYHEVTAFSGFGELYSVSSHKAFRALIENMELVR